MKCSDIMTDNPTCCTPNDTVDRAAQIMKKEDVGSVPVVESQDAKKLVGIVTDRDLAIKVLADGLEGKQTKVEQVMTRNPISCRPDDDVQKALDAMEQRQVRRIPVVDNDNRVVGIIAQADVATRLQDPRETAEVVEEISKEAGRR